MKYKLLLQFSKNTAAVEITRIDYSKLSESYLLIDLVDKIDNNLKITDLEIIFTGLTPFVKIIFYECELVYLSDTTIKVNFDNDLTYPAIHSKIFDWIDLRINNEVKTRIWHNFSNQEKYNWLRLNYYFQIYTPKKSMEKCIIDGKFFKDKLGFLCELGEQLFGVGGYAGSDLDGCYDILTNGLSDISQLDSNLEIIWLNYSYSIRNIECNELVRIKSMLESAIKLTLVN